MPRGRNSCHGAPLKFPPAADVGALGDRWLSRTASVLARAAEGQKSGLGPEILNDMEGGAGQEADDSNGAGQDADCSNPPSTQTMEGGAGHGQEADDSNEWEDDGGWHDADDSIEGVRNGAAVPYC